MSKDQGNKENCRPMRCSQTKILSKKPNAILGSTMSFSETDKQTQNLIIVHFPKFISDIEGTNLSEEEEKLVKEIVVTTRKPRGNGWRSCLPNTL